MISLSLIKIIIIHVDDAIFAVTEVHYIIIHNNKHKCTSVTAKATTNNSKSIIAINSLALANYCVSITPNER